jgi:predicted nucleotidyltransferase
MNSFSSSSAPAVAARFTKLIQRTQLTSRDVALFESHRATIKRVVEERLDCVKVELMGSFQRGTAIHGASDVDLLVVLKTRSLTWGTNLKSSSTVLTEVRDALRERYPNTAVGKDGQAVVAQFSDGAHPVDVVPGGYGEQGGPYNHPLFLIPDGSGDWIMTSPSSHNRYIAEGDHRAGGKLKYAAQLFKFWRTSRRIVVPISGFHTELLMAAQGTCDGARSYSLILRDLLVSLANRDCAALRDPLSISGLIGACSTEAKRQSAVRTVAEAATHADAALHSEFRGDTREAVRQWNIVFNGEFPA